MKPTRKGFTLVEALCTLFLVGIVLFVVGTLLNNAAKVSRKTNRMSQVTAAAALLEFAVLDIERAEDFSLSPGLETDHLRMRIRRVERPEMLADTPLPPDDPELLKHVTYRVTSGQFLKVTEFESDPTETEVLGEAEEFYATLSPTGQVQVRLVLKDGEEIRKEAFPLALASLAAPL